MVNGYTWFRGYKTFFVLHLTEHEICPANKSQIAYNCLIPSC